MPRRANDGSVCAAASAPTSRDIGPSDAAAETRFAGRRAASRLAAAGADHRQALAGARGTQVTVGDASGGPDAIMRFQRLTIAPALASELAAIGDGTFAATVIVVQDDPEPDDGLHEGFELWPRGAEDID